MTRSTLRAFSALALALTGCDEACDSGDLCTWLGTGEAGVAFVGENRLDAMVYAATDLAFAPDGTPYVLDWNNHRIFSIDENEAVVAVTGEPGLLGDGPAGPASAALWNHPTGIGFKAGDSDHVYVAAWHNSRIHHIDNTLDAVSFECGTGGRNFGGDGGPAAQAVLDLPVAVDFDEDGVMYIADQANRRIRRVGTDGIITTIAGTGEHGYNGDGIPAVEASFAGSALQRAEPSSKIDYHEGALYVADTMNGRVRRIDLATGIIETIAGMGSAPLSPEDSATNPDGCTEGCGYSGDGGPAVDAELNGPVDVVVASDGVVFVADTENHCVRAIATDGTIDTVAGQCGTPGDEGEFGPANEALLNRPFGLALTPDGVLHIADTGNHKIKHIVP